MNDNFIQKKLKNFVSEVSGFFFNLPVLPAGLWFAVNFALISFNKLLKQIAALQSGISKFLRGGKTQQKLNPVFITVVLYSYKNTD